MYGLYAMFSTFATPSGHTGCDSYETRHLHKMMAAGRLPWESEDSDDESSMWPALAGLGLSTVSLVFLRGGVRVAVEVDKGVPW